MRKKPNVLVVDDNPDVLVAIRLLLMEVCEKIEATTNPNEVSRLMREFNFDVVILDMNFVAGINSGNEGYFWMQEVLKTDPDIMVVFLTAYGDVERAVKAMREGAFDFIEKPWEDEKIVSSVMKAFEVRNSKLEIKKLNKRQKHLKDTINKQYRSYRSVSSSMRQVYKMIEKVAVTDANVLILGENGTGKEVIAREIHQLSARTNNLFLNIDVGAVSETLFESEMFGHTKGAFTDAKDAKTGKFELASGGSLFLDEVGNLAMNLQSKLLSVIQNREVTPLGEEKSIEIDIRLITATNKDIYNMVSESLFREDLLYRLNTVVVELPPLRERLEDIPGLVKYFINDFSVKYRKGEMSLEDKALDKLLNYSWPGNIRELQHTVEKAIILCESNILTESDFFFRKSSAQIAFSSLNIEENEKHIIRAAMRKHLGNHTGAANELGITRRTLYNKLKKYGV